MYHNTHSHRLKPREECKDVPQEVILLKTFSTAMKTVSTPMKTVFNAKTIPNETFSKRNSGLCPTDRGKRDWEEAGDQTLVLHLQVPEVFSRLCWRSSGSTFFVLRKGRLPPQRIEQRREKNLQLSFQSGTWQPIKYSWILFALQMRAVLILKVLSYIYQT